MGETSRVAAFRALALLAALVAVAPAEAGEFSATIPTGVPNLAMLATWEKVTGDVQTATESVVYQLYVNPRRLALYEVTRYRVTRISRDAKGHETRDPGTEKFLWNAGGGEHLHCFERKAPGGWVRMEEGTPEYRWEMGMAMHVYGLHRLALAKD